VVILEDGGHGVRAYVREDHRFVPASPDTTTVLLDEAGAAWRTTESGLIGPGGEVLRRLPGDMAYWFGWFSFFPQTVVYGFEGG
jgi:hypothetical protein